MATAKKAAKTSSAPRPTSSTTAWSAAPPPAAAPPQWASPAVPPTQSGMLKAGTILLLVGAILHAVGAFFLIVVSVVMIAVGGALADEGDGAFVPAIVGIVYLVFGILLAVGSYFGFSAWKKAKANVLHRAWIHGLVSALLPPLQMVTLLGAIFVLVSPEHDAQEKAKGAWQGQKA